MCGLFSFFRFVTTIIFLYTKGCGVEGSRLTQKKTFCRLNLAISHCYRVPIWIFNMKKKSIIVREIIYPNKWKHKGFRHCSGLLRPFEKGGRDDSSDPLALYVVYIFIGEELTRLTYDLVNLKWIGLCLYMMTRLVQGNIVIYPV